MQSFEIHLSALDGSNPLGFLAGLGALVVLRGSDEPHAKLGWRQSTSWTPVLYTRSAWTPEALCAQLARVLAGREVPAPADEIRERRQKEFAAAKKAVADKEKEFKKRGLRGKERQVAREEEVLPLERVRDERRVSWLEALKEAVPRPELALGLRIDCEPQEFRTHAKGFLADAASSHRETVDLLAAFGSDACVDKSERIQATPFCFITHYRLRPPVFPGHSASAP